MFKGRLMPSTGTLIENPIDALRYIKSCQNWSELGITGDWGHDYVASAKIKMSGKAAFTSPYLDEIRGLKIARQILSQGEAWTNDIAQSLCEQFFLISYQDENGFECVKSLFTKENAVDVITYRDIKKAGDIIEPQLSDVYCAPIINYAYDYATEKYTKQLKVYNAWESAWQASFTPGMTEADGAEIWATCHALWLKIRQIEPMPDDMTNKIWVPDYDTAMWCLRKHLQLMSLKRYTFDISYSKGRRWCVGDHKCLLLPHETNNIPIEIVIESITKNKDTNTVNLHVILLDTIDNKYLYNLAHIVSEGLQLQDSGIFEIKGSV